MKLASEVVEAIDQGYDDQPESRPREYIGASIIGTACEAAVAFNLRGFPNSKPSPRLKRIFALGHILEDMVVEDLKKRADMRVWEVDGLTGEQHTCEEWGGHVVCHMDGHVEIGDEVYVLEVKSMNDNSFKKFKDKGVQRSHPQYFGQVQMMMGLSGMKRCMFIAINKNNCEYHIEYVDFDDFEFGYIRERVRRVLHNEARKISNDPADWRCQGCFKREGCWGGREPEKKCATCAHALAQPDGGWKCLKHGGEALRVCDDYQIYQPHEKRV